MAGFPIDWDAEARMMADHVSENLFPAHRGVIPWRQLGVVVAFGNDGFTQDERTQAEVGILRESLGRAGIRILGFGTNTEDSYSWAMPGSGDSTSRSLYVVPNVEG